MNNKTTGIVATVATVILCGCPGIFLCLFGALTVAGQGTFNDQSLSPTVGFALVLSGFDLHPDPDRSRLCDVTQETRARRRADQQRAASAGFVNRLCATKNFSATLNRREVFFGSIFY